MKTIRIFISSPGDVAEERTKAKQVISALQSHYGDDVKLVAVLWEDLAIPATASFQEGIDLVLTERHRVDIAVFILWSRLGSPLGDAITKRDGTPYRSGTEREFDLMLEAFEQSGQKVPVILAYTRDDIAGFNDLLDATSKADKALREILDQRELVKKFIYERFHDEKGRNLRAYHSYREPVAFAQRLYTHLRGEVDELLAQEHASAQWHEAPYRRLEVFDIRHAPVFFGRDEETFALLQRLRDQQSAGCAFVCIVGASGSGKSSLARAGVAATLMQRSFDDGIKEWRTTVFTPSQAQGELFSVFARCLAEPLPELYEGVGGLEKVVKCFEDENHEAADILIETAFMAASAKLCGPLRLLLVLDQMEELWTDRKIKADQPNKFLQTIEALAHGSHISILATLRSDFYPQAQLSEAYLRMKGERGHFDLTAPGVAAIQQIIVRPAHRAGLTFERDEHNGRTLDHLILGDAARDPSALPLLQYALAELYECREKTERLLTLKAYNDMGGVEGALGKRAAQTFDGLPVEVRAALEGLLPQLVSVDIAGEHIPVRLCPMLSSLTVNPECQRLIEALTKARFLVTYEQNGVARAMLAHDALLQRCDQISSWAKRNRELLRMRAQVALVASDWIQEKDRPGGRSEDLLLAEGLPLYRGQHALAAGILDDQQAAFVSASVKHAGLAQQRRRLRLQLLTVVAVVVALATGVLAWHSVQKAKEVQELLADSDHERAQRLFKENDSNTALWHLARSVASGYASEEARHRLAFVLLQRSWPVLGSAQSSAGSILAAGFSSDGAGFTTASREGQVLLRRTSDCLELGGPLPHPRSVRGSLFSPDGRWLLTACDDAVARLWDLQSSQSQLIAECKHQDVVAGIAWDIDGGQFATGSWDKSVRVWDSTKPGKPGFTATMGDRVHTVAFHPRDKHLLLAVAKDTVKVWDIRAGHEHWSFQATADLHGAFFTPDGLRVVSFGEEPEVRISPLDPEMGRESVILLPSSCHTAVVSPNGALIAVASDRQVLVYETKLLTQPLWEHTFPVRAGIIRFTADSTLLLCGCADGRVEIHHPRTNRKYCEPAIRAGPVTALACSPAGDTILCVHAGNDVSVWNLPAFRPVPSCVVELGAPMIDLAPIHADTSVAWLAAHDGKATALVCDNLRQMDFARALTAVAQSHDGRWLMGGTADGLVLKLATDGKSAPVTIGKLEAAVTHLSLADNGFALAAGAEDGGLAVWDWASGRALEIGVSGHSDKIAGLIWLKDNATLVSAGWDRKLHIKNVKAAAESVSPIALPSEPVAIAALAGGGAVLALTNREVWLREADSDGFKRMPVGVSSQPVCLLPDRGGERVAFGLLSGHVAILDLKPPHRLLEIACGEFRINDMAFGRGDGWLAVALEDGFTQIWDSRSGQLLSERMWHPGPVRKVRFEHGDTRLWSVDRDGLACAWLAPDSVPLVVLQTVAQSLMGSQSGVAASLTHEMLLPFQPIPSPTSPQALPEIRSEAAKPMAELWRRANRATRAQ